MSINLEFYENFVFPFDEPAPLELSNGTTIFAYPVSLKQSFEYYGSIDVLKKDRRDSKETEELEDEMEFYINYVFKDPSNITKMGRMLKLCLHFDDPQILVDEDGYYFSTRNINEDNELVLDESIKIRGEDLLNIKSLVQHQNDSDFDDSIYFSPKIRKNMELEAKLKNKGKKPPNLERKFAIITVHTGIMKDQLLNMTMRGFDMLFNEVVEEAEFFASYALRARYAEKGKAADHWIWKDEVKGLNKVGTSLNGFLSNLGMGGDGITDINQLPTQ